VEFFGVSGNDQRSGDLVYEGLKKLEYRGYDSWGICVRDFKSGSPITEKEVGKISDGKKNFPDGVEAIGHSRWATHGGVTQANAHPHTVGKVTLVHNGIFENYLEHKKNLKQYSFVSETDTEVIAALVNKFFEQGNSPQESIQKAAREIEGRFALLLFFEGHDGIYAARSGSPLIVGRGEQETYIASDIPAFLEQTNVVNYIDDGEMVYIHKEKAEFYNLETGAVVEKRNIEVPWKLEEAEKGEYDHFMIKEIFEQKDTIARAINHSKSDLEKAVELLKNSNGTYLVACGTANKVAMVAEYFFTDIAGRKVNVVPASEMPSFERFINHKTAVMAISQSGETADVLEILERSKAKGAKILSLTNVESSSIARMSRCAPLDQRGTRKSRGLDQGCNGADGVVFFAGVCGE
jgi:glucosamine--fructose-6-phosphate aminotransferase (isomerizing)